MFIMPQDTVSATSTYSMLAGKCFVVVSYWGYPFGGGEEYLYQSAIWAQKSGMKSYWISFATADNKPYNTFSINYDQEPIIMINIADGFNADTLSHWLRLLDADIVHHQGGYRRQIYDVCRALRIEMITGIHFWNGIILLDPVHFNVEIMKHLDVHRIDPDFEYLYDAPFCNFYAASDFVADCVLAVTQRRIDNVAYASSMSSRCAVTDIDPKNNLYVTAINIHKMKGGEIILHLIKTLPHIPFMVVQTEFQSEELDQSIRDAIHLRDESCAQCIFMERTADIKSVYALTKIFLAPSLVDETFCRTVNEAMMNGIPVITTGRGNIKYLTPEIIIDADDLDQWTKTVDQLYHDPLRLEKLSELSLVRHSVYSEVVAQTQFIDIVSNVYENSKARNVMIFAPWCDQGLGIQSRNYYLTLVKNGFNVSIFSYRPYNGNSTIEMQKDPSEWLVDRIYYSSNVREKVQDSEIINFINKYNIGKCIIPETCWFRIFEIAKLLRSNAIRCYAVPNIEIVRRDEIAKHKWFYRILCNNRLCEKIFHDYGITNTHYIGYSIDDRGKFYRPKQIDNNTDILDNNKTRFKFLFIGGMNAFSRKHILEICEAFVIAINTGISAELTCTIQKTNNLEVDDVSKLVQYKNHPNINFIEDHLAYNDIIQLYQKHHISIQVSKHEGLGLGFYEALATGTPVITLDTPPHNEIILNGVNGWVISCYHKKMTDNPDSFIESAYFHPTILAQKICEICKNRKHYGKILKNLVKDYQSRLSNDQFLERVAKI